MLPSLKNRLRFNGNDPFEDPEFKRSWESVINLNTDANSHRKMPKPSGEVKDNLYFQKGEMYQFGAEHVTSFKELISYF